MQHSIAELAVPGVSVDHRRIQLGDETFLLPAERVAFAGAVDKVGRASGAARIVARALLLTLGHEEQPIPKGPMGAPIWPEGIVGSLAHDAEVAIAALAYRRDYSGLGIDVEPAGPLDAELLDIVATANERQAIAKDPYRGRLLFAAKEAVYKAVNPLDRVFLDHKDVEIDLTARVATTRTGRNVNFRYCISSRIVVLAFLPS